MTTRNGTESGLYVPPARRSESGSSNGGTPKKNSEEGPSREPPINCCEDREGGELEDSPSKDTKSSISSSSSHSWRKPCTSSNIEQDLQRNLQIGKMKFQDVRIPVTQRTIKVNNTRRDHESSDDTSPKKGSRRGESRFSNFENDRLLEKFYQTNVPFIDSHCHTDFMYDTLNRQKIPEGHDGIQEWMEKYPDAFPRAFCGLIANFINPKLFVHVKGSEDCDLEWIVRELDSNFYLGTTWGCHPHHVSKWGRLGTFWATLELILSQKYEYKVLAIGECGIDQHKCESSLEDQRYVFDKHVALAFKYDLPLVIHCRNGSKGHSEDECLDILRKQMDKNHRYLKIHRHCFTEDWDTAQKWLKQCPDVHFGFTGAIMAFSEPQIDAVRRIPLDRILLETDGPYFKPKCFDLTSPFRLCFPGMAIATADRIAEIKNISLEEVLRATYNNTKRVYQIPVYDFY